MKRLPSAMFLARLSGSLSCISAELPRSETFRPWAAIAFLVAAISPAENSGRLGRSRSPRMQRISTAEKPLADAKSRIFANGHCGQPRVEKARRGVPPAGKAGARAARVEVTRNSRRVMFMCTSEWIAGILHLGGCGEETPVPRGY